MRVGQVGDMESKRALRSASRPCQRTRLMPVFLVPVLVALAACSGSAPAIAPPRIADTPVVTISASESDDVDAPLQFHVHAQPAPATDLTVSVTVAADGCDLTQSIESVTIVAGQGRVVFDVLTTGLTDGESAGCTVTVTIAAGEGYQVGAAASAVATVMPVGGPALPFVSIRPSGPTSIVEGAEASWTLSAAPAPATQLTVDLHWTESGSVLPELRPPNVTIPASGTATVSVATVDDDTDEPDGTVTLRVAVGSGYTVGTPESVTITVTDNDLPVPIPVVSIRATGATTIVEGEEASWTVSASPAPATDLAVGLAWTQSSSVLPELRPPNVTIPASGTATVSVDTVDDDIDEDDGTVTLSLVAGSGYTVGTRDAAAIAVTDNDPDLRVATARILQTEVTEGQLYGAEITLTLLSTSTVATTVKIRLLDSAIDGYTETDLLFASGQSDRTVRVFVMIVDENQADRTVTIRIVGGSASSGYRVGNPQSATIPVVDNGN